MIVIFHDFSGVANASLYLWLYRVDTSESLETGRSEITVYFRLHSPLTPLRIKQKAES